MSQFVLHNVNSAPEGSKPLLEGVQKTLGFIPNLYGHLAESPAALEAYLTLSDIFDKSSFSPAERQIVLLAASVENACEFCVAAHSFIAKNVVKVAPDVVTALRDPRPLADAKLQALAELTRAIVRERGLVVDSGALRTFLDAGYTNAQVLDVILGVSLKTLSNYSNHVAQTAVNPQFESEAWRPNATRAA